MKEKISDKKKILFGFTILLIVSIVTDLNSTDMLKGGVVQRGEIGEKDTELELEMDIEGVIEDYPYSLTVEAIAPTKEEADRLFDETILIIEEDFKEVKTKAPLKESYLEDKVEAKWRFLPYGIIDEKGEVKSEKLLEDITWVQAEVALQCGNYKREYTFSFPLEKPKPTEQEAMLLQVEKEIASQMEEEGTAGIVLPTKINGKTIKWSKHKEYITPKILLLEGIAAVMVYFLSIKKKKEDFKKRISEMEEDYPDLVSQLALLLSAGMTTRQAWNRIANLYHFKRKSNIVKEKEVYEGIVRMNRLLSEGESERTVYQKFSEEIPAGCYRKLMRILVGNLEKGAQGISRRLEEESQFSFEQKINIAKKKGEEASTRMMLPLMIMMLIVMGVVILPAMLEFRI